MDYRHREYYLVRFYWFERAWMVHKLKELAPSIKMHKPYNHFVYKITDKLDKSQIGMQYDGKYSDITGMHFVDTMISCKIDESDALEYELRKMTRYSKEFKFFKLSRECCKQ